MWRPDLISGRRPLHDNLQTDWEGEDFPASPTARWPRHFWGVLLKGHCFTVWNLSQLLLVLWFMCSWLLPGISPTCWAHCSNKSLRRSMLNTLFVCILKIELVFRAMLWLWLCLIYGFAHSDLSMSWSINVGCSFLALFAWLSKSKKEAPN